VRAGDWRVAPLPADLLDRRVEITGPVDRKMIINALNSGANVFMADFEDSNSPTWANMVRARSTSRRRAPHHRYTRPETGKRTAERATACCSCGRAAGTCPSALRVDGRDARARLFDFGLYFFHNAEGAHRARHRPVLLPAQAGAPPGGPLWNDVFVLAQDALGIAARHDQGHGAHRDAARGLRDGRDPLRAARALRGPQLRPLGLHLQLHQEAPADPAALLPDRAVRSRWTRPSCAPTRSCSSRPATAAACTRWAAWRRRSPSRTTRRANAAALAKVRADKLREVTDGHDGTWVAHPGLVPIAQEVFDEHMPTPTRSTASATT
jgi:malate synthase